MEFFAIDNALRPMTSVFAFTSLYVFLPLLSFALALILCASGANLFFKLLFPVVSLITIPLGYSLIEADRGIGSNLSLEHLSADLGLALLIAFLPATLGTVIGLIIRVVEMRGRKRRQAAAATRKGTNTRTAAGARRGSGTLARSGPGTRAKTRSGTGPPPLTVQLNTTARTRSNARSSTGMRMPLGAGIRSATGAGGSMRSSVGTKTRSSTTAPNASRSKKRR
jgi:hypothetical protein